MGRYAIQYLPNGFYRIDDRRSGLTGLYTSDGSKHSGQLSVNASALIAEYLKIIQGR